MHPSHAAATPVPILRASLGRGETPVGRRSSPTRPSAARRQARPASRTVVQGLRPGSLGRSGWRRQVEPSAVASAPAEAAPLLGGRRRGTNQLRRGRRDRRDGRRPSRGPPLAAPRRDPRSSARPASRPWPSGRVPQRRFRRRSRRSPTMTSPARAAAAPPTAPSRPLGPSSPRRASRAPWPPPRRRAPAMTTPAARWRRRRRRAPARRAR
mmetsp:Transcript_87057/g.251439  ORF Transcript_87057/g.251439 Transcript_87057/m.251439 type:complete len:211 (+) Transcript_87057:271-903(+)